MPVGQVPDLLHEIKETAARGERVLVTALTKRMSEDLHEHFQERDMRERQLQPGLELPKHRHGVIE